MKPTKIELVESCFNSELTWRLSVSAILVAVFIKKLLFYSYLPLINWFDGRTWPINIFDMEMVHFSISLLWRRKIGREKECKCRFSFILNIVFGKKWHLNPISIVKVNFSSLSLRLYCNIFRECRFSLINRRCIELNFMKHI